MMNLEQDIMCVLLQRLLDKNLITPKIFDNAREKILDTFDSAEFFCYHDVDRKEEEDGHTQNSG